MIGQEKSKSNKILYIVQPQVESSSESSWLGNLNAMKKYMDKTVKKSQSVLSNKVERVYDRVIEGEFKNAANERSMKQSLKGLEKLCESVNEKLDEVHNTQQVQKKELAEVKSAVD